MNKNAINQSSRTASLEHYSLLENFRDDPEVTTRLTVCKASEAFKAVEEFIEKVNDSARLSLNLEVRLFDYPQDLKLNMHTTLTQMLVAKANSRKRWSVRIY